jgi:hypothetical protein
MLGPDGVHMGTGYAGGNLGKNPEGKNNPAMQNLHNIGPLPRGFYTFAPPTENRVGPFGIPLVPNPYNEMFGRGHFYCHGDLIGSPGSGSEGCIAIARTVRHAMWASDVHRLLVVRGEAPGNAAAGPMITDAEIGMA